MDSQQDTLSRSYTDSISSYLYNRIQDESENTQPTTNFYNSDIHSQSVNSNLSYHQTPIIAVRSMADEESNMLRRGSIATTGGSSFYGSIITADSESFYKNDDAATPLPKLQMLVISIILLSEPLTSTILFPFIYFMLKDFHLSDDEKEIGTYAGWITSIFFIAQFCTAIMWGKVSDRYGRRPVLLTGLVGNTLSTCLFGLSKNLWWAIGARAICGIMNGNGGVARSMVSEITDNTNKAKAFSIFGFCWGAGMIGPALGGFLNRPAQQYPNIFGDWQFLIDYPYFLPCFISALGSMIGFIVGFFYLEESNPSVIASRKWDADNRQRNEQTTLLKSTNETVTQRIIPKSGSMRLITKASYSVIFAYSLFSFHAMVFEEVLPLYFTAPVYAGGLGVTSADFAKALSFFGIAQLVLQFDTYPRLTKRFSTLTLCRVAFLAFIPIYLILPELSVLREFANGSSTSWTFRMGYIFVLFFRYFGNCLAFTGLGIMVSTSAAPEVLGTVNGLCQSCLALVRAMGPTFGGTLWSISIKDGTRFPFDRHLVYYLIAAMSLFSFIQSFSIPKSVALGGKSKAHGNH